MLEFRTLLKEIVCIITKDLTWLKMYMTTDYLTWVKNKNVNNAHVFVYIDYKHDAISINVVKYGK